MTVLMAFPASPGGASDFETVKDVAPLMLTRDGDLYEILDRRTGSVLWTTDSRMSACSRFGKMLRDLRKDRVTERPCLRCREPILLEGPHHRMRDTCRHIRPSLI